MVNFEDTWVKSCFTGTFLSLGCVTEHHLIRYCTEMFNMELGQAQTLQHLQTSHTQLFPQLTQLSQNRLKKRNNK